MEGKKKRKVSNIQLMNHIKKKFLEKSSSSKGLRDDIRNNLVDYIKSIVTSEFEFNQINLNDLEGLGIQPTEKNLMIKLSLEKMAGEPVDNAIKHLMYFMNLTENNLEDLDDFLLAGYDLYQDLLTDFNPLTSGTLIQYLCALLEEYLKKFYSIKTGVKLTGWDKFLTLAPLITKVFHFSPYKDQRTKMQLKEWQVTLVWSYELRNLLMHNVFPIPIDTFQKLFYLLISTVLLTSFEILSLYQDWFIMCPHCKNKNFIKFIPLTKPIQCIFCNKEIQNLSTSKKNT
ncbi:MAG TPA: hypothetical protein VMV49_02010 [Candidatus Deferrimicrobium sp.]|nr:hypothetical protein [Candidatus Deferrimicrobium sp.]